MSRSSRRSLREKSIARRVLERAAHEEIDEFVLTRGRKEELRESYEDCGPDEDLDDVFGSMVPDEDWYDYQEYWDDLEDDDYCLDDYCDMGGPERLSGDVGAYYKDRENRTYLCCRVHGVTVYVNILTGCACDVNQFQFEKVG